jgi:hypothetical protein
VKAEDGKTTLKLICAGGVLPLRIMGVEVHGLFGETTPNEKGQYQMYNTGAGPDKDPVTFEVAGMYKTPEEIKNITIEVFKENKWMELKATRGEPACKILVDDVNCKEHDYLRLPSYRLNYEVAFLWYHNVC